MPKKDIPEDEGPSDEWLASYADAMTLLLAFFIMMYAFALVDLAKFQDLKIGVSAAFGHANPVTDNTDSVLEDGTGLLPELGFNPASATGEDQADMQAAREALAAAGLVTAENAEQLRALLDQAFENLGAGDLVEVSTDERGVVIRFDGRVLFAANKADLNPDGLTVLITAANVLDLIDNPLEIEGHTDNRPVGTPWISNWELSSARASSVVRWLIEYGRLPGAQMMAVGRADTRPRGDNTTAEGRAENRRVEIVVRVNDIADPQTASMVVPTDPASDTVPTDTVPTDTVPTDPAQPADGTVPADTGEPAVAVTDGAAATTSSTGSSQPVTDPAVGADG